MDATLVAPSTGFAPHDGFDDSQSMSLRLLCLSCCVAGVKSAFIILLAF
jgi:hypothetical protein